MLGVLAAPGRWLILQCTALFRCCDAGGPVMKVTRLRGYAQFYTVIRHQLRRSKGVGAWRPLPAAPPPGQAEGGLHSRAGPGQGIIRCRQRRPTELQRAADLWTCSRGAGWTSTGWEPLLAWAAAMPVPAMEWTERVRYIRPGPGPSSGAACTLLSFSF